MAGGAPLHGGLEQLYEEALAALERRGRHSGPRVPLEREQAQALGREYLVAAGYRSATGRHALNHALEES